MVIKSLKLKNYRNYELLDMTFDSKTNILYGDNAQGKTNILEALYLSGTTKSHRGTKDRDLIQFGREESHLETIVEKKGMEFQIDMHLKKNSPKQNFIAMIARKYSSCAEMEDLEQEGYIGLYEAVKHYDTSSEVPFINYAAFWIRQVMRRYIDNCGRVVRIPTHAVDKMQRYKKIKSEYQKYYGKIPTDREMSAFMGMDEESLKSIKKTAAMGQIRSLDEPINSDEEDIYIGDTIASKEDVEADVIDRIDSDIMTDFQICKGKYCAVGSWKRKPISRQGKNWELV